MAGMCSTIYAVLRKQYRILELVLKVSTTWPPCITDWVSVLYVHLDFSQL